ncbi:hypothetical protein CDAR_608921 [Caerostris darwini]|uniref:Uncharacterized protein n=1 Tax=Caerostris darwini TaxID=1538125 RepID=A0AAV4WJJ0_9ARAC|nr:hypothetical protein CDAR_608921 [Caerostris darwini]
MRSGHCIGKSHKRNAIFRLHEYFSGFDTAIQCPRMYVSCGCPTGNPVPHHPVAQLLIGDTCGPRLKHEPELRGGLNTALKYRQFDNNLNISATNFVNILEIASIELEEFSSLCEKLIE